MHTDAKKRYHADVSKTKLKHLFNSEPTWCRVQHSVAQLEADSNTVLSHHALS